MAHDFRSRLLRCRNDAPLHSSLRSRSPWYNFPRFSPPVGRHDCGRHSHQQDGSGIATSIRSDAGSTVGYFHGQLREWGWLLPLQLLGYKRLRQDCARGYLCTGMPSNIRSAHVRYLPIAKEDETYKDYTHVVQEIGKAPCLDCCGLVWNMYYLNEHLEGARLYKLILRHAMHTYFALQII